MITAKDAREQSDKIRFANISPDEQLKEVISWIEKQVQNGSRYTSFKEELHPINTKKLEELGYQIRSGGLNSSSKWHDVIYW